MYPWICDSSAGQAKEALLILSAVAGQRMSTLELTVIYCCKHQPFIASEEDSMQLILLYINMVPDVGLLTTSNVSNT